MAPHAPPTLDLTRQEEAARVLPHRPVIDSYRTGWRGVAFVHYCHPPHKTVEHRILQHSVVVTHPQSHFRAERRLDGKLEQYDHGNGRVDVIPAHLSHWTHWNREIEFSVVALCPTLLSQAAGLEKEIELIPQLSIDDPVIQQLAIALKLEIQTGCLSGQIFGESLGIALATRLMQNYAINRPTVKCETAGLSRSQLKLVVDYIQANLAQPISILDMATLIGMSSSHFSRSFKQSVGVSPYRYLMQQRIKRAQYLLRQPSNSISMIALECGFANQTHLTKVFRQLTGTTPKAYRRQ